MFDKKRPQEPQEVTDASPDSPLLTIKDWHNKAVAEITNYAERLNISPVIRDLLLQSVVPSNPKFSGEGLIGLTDIGSNNHKFSCWVRKDTGVFKEGVLTRTFSQGQAIPSFSESWDTKLVSAVMSIPLARTENGDIYLGLAPKQTPGIGWYWKGAGGFASNKVPGPAEASTKLSPGIDWMDAEISRSPGFQVAAAAELREELVGNAPLSWAVMTGIFPQEPCHSSEIYGGMAIGIDVSSTDALKILQGNEPDFGQGKTFWVKVHSGHDSSLAINLYRAAASIPNIMPVLPTGIQAADPQTAMAILRIAAVMDNLEQLGVQNPWAELSRPFPDGVPNSLLKGA